MKLLEWAEKASEIVKIAERNTPKLYITLYTYVDFYTLYIIINKNSRKVDHNDSSVKCGRNNNTAPKLKCLNTRI